MAEMGVDYQFVPQSEQVSRSPLDELRAKLRAPLPEGAIKQHPTKSYMSSVNSMYVIERLNDVFGENGWRADYTIMEANPTLPMVVVRCELTVEALNIYRQAFGGNDNKDRGDAYKGACTDALTKAASQLGIAQDVYKGMYDKELVSDEGGKKGGRKPKPEEFGSVEGIVNNYQQLTPTALWLKVGETPCRAIDKAIMAQLQNSLGKKVELRVRWDLGKDKKNIMTIVNVMGIYEPVPGQTQYVPVPESSQLDGPGIAPKVDFKRK